MNLLPDNLLVRFPTLKDSSTLLSFIQKYEQAVLGQALLLYSFGEFARRGMNKASLSVDPQIAATAVRLYKRVGMSVADIAYQYAKELCAS